MTRRNNIYRLAALLYIGLICINVHAQQDLDVILKAKAYIQAGHPSQAIGILTDAIRLNENSQLFVERGEACLSGKDYSGAIRDFNQANNLTEHSGDYGLARVYAFKGDVNTSLYHLGRHLSSGFRKSEKEVMLEPAFEVLENRSEWRQFWKKDWYSFAEKSVSEIEFLASKGDVEECRSVLSELKKNYPASEEVTYAEAMINLSESKYNEAVSASLRLTAADPGNEKYLRLLAKAQSGQSNPAGASSTYTKLLDNGTADAQLFLLRAECYRKTKETDKALQDIEKYLELYPENKGAISLAGKTEAESGDNLKAIEYFNKNLKLHPNDADCYIDRGNSYFVAKSWEWAVKDYSMSLDLQPGNAETWLNKGVALLSSGNIKDACHDFKRSFNLGNQKASSYISKNCMSQ